MTTTINPPDFSSKNFEIYKLQLRAWSEVTEIKKSKQAIVIALSIQDFAISENVFSQLSVDDLNQENGLDILIKFLDSILGKDELTDTLEKYEDFENCQRADNQTIREFIASFDLKYKKLEKLKIKLPSEILALKLIRKANISKQMRMLVLTGIDFSTKETMYKQSQESLRKFFGDIQMENAWIGLNMREGAHRNDFIADGFKKYGCKQTKPARYGNRKINGLCSKNGFRKRINPVEADGNRLLCISCGSYRHLLEDCPDSWENIEKREESFEKQMKPMNQSIKETTKCTEGSGGGPEPDMQGACRGNTAGFMAEIDSLKKEIDNMKHLLKERRVEDKKQVENMGKQKNSEYIKS